MLRLIFAIIFLWILHSRAHLESHPNLLLRPPNIVVSSDDTPVKHGEISGGEVKTGERPWRSPDYSAQQGALGYKNDVFQIPKGLEKNVQFWTDIYTKYSTSQGLVHDSEYVDVIYEVVDFSHVEKDPSMSGSAKEKMKKKLVNEAKDRASESLRRLQEKPDLNTLSRVDRRLWEAMKDIDSPNKFAEANDKNRLRFQLGQSDRMKEAIFFSGRYLEEFEQIFKEEGLPIELTRLVFVESSFNILARSKVGASGLWQIMPSVARPKKMMSAFVDRRNDPWDATRLAAQVLAGNFRMLGEWPLAITGYNHGPNGVRRLVNKYQTKDISELVQNVRSKRSFGFASRNFYASFLAALNVEKNAKSHFADIRWSEKLNSIPHRTTGSLPYRKLAEIFNLDYKQLEIYNPHLTSKVKSSGGVIPTGTKIYIPVDKVSFLEKSGNERHIAEESDKARP